MPLWTPVSCSLQLNFSHTPELHIGSPYTGISTIRYRSGGPTLPDRNGSTPSRWTRGLHLHAATTTSGTGTGTAPLTVQEYKLARVGPRVPLPITAILDGAPTSPDPDARTVHFPGMDDDACFPEGAVVELTVAFTAAVRGQEEGGVYVGAARGPAPPPLLTHFEVHLARTAFPCPDDPLYRLEWTLASLQLPARYRTVVTHTTALEQREVATAHGPAIHLRYGPVGPLPVYVLAFAAFPHGSLLTLHGEITVASPASWLAGEPDENPLRLPVSVHASRDGGISETTLQETLNTLVDAVAFMTDFFASPLPLCGCDALQLLLAPTMPCLSGMEHHGCIFLNQDLFRDGGGGTAAARAELIAHEVAHHWVGNRVGFPFAVKEGVCQVLERLAADAYLGRPPRQLVAIGGGPAPSPSRVDAGGAKGKAGGRKGSRAAAVDKEAKSAITEVTRGKEFTGRSYQQALAEVQNWIVEKGVDAFCAAMRTVMREHVLRVEAEVDSYGGREAMGYAGLPEPEPPYFTAEAFLALLASAEGEV